MTDGNDVPEWSKNTTFYVPENSIPYTSTNITLKDYCTDQDVNDKLSFEFLDTEVTTTNPESSSCSSDDDASGMSDDSTDDDGCVSQSSSDDGAFYVNASTGEVFVGTAELDYEGDVQFYTINVRCEDNGEDSGFTNLYADTYIYIYPADRNDAPSFDKAKYTMTVPENSPNGTIPNANYEIVATDQDAPPDTIDYSLVNTAGIFKIHETTGKLHVWGDVDINYEQNQSFVLTVEAYRPRHTVVGSIDN